MFDIKKMCEEVHEYFCQFDDTLPNMSIAILQMLIEYYALERDINILDFYDMLRENAEGIYEECGDLREVGFNGKRS